MFSFLIRWLSFAAGENRLEFRIMIQPIKTHVYLRRPRESESLWRPKHRTHCYIPGTQGQAMVQWETEWPGLSLPND